MQIERKLKARSGVPDVVFGLLICVARWLESPPGCLDSGKESLLLGVRQFSRDGPLCDLPWNHTGVSTLLFMTTGADAAR